MFSTDGVGDRDVEGACIFVLYLLAVVRHAWAGKRAVDEANEFVIIICSFLKFKFCMYIISSQFSML